MTPPETNQALINEQAQIIKQLNLQLKIAQSRTEFISKVAKLGIWEWDTVKDQAVCNREWYESAGYANKEFEMNLVNFTKLAHPDDIDAYTNQIAAYVTGKSTKSICKVRFKHKNGDWVWTEENYEVIDRDEDGLPARILGTRVVLNNEHYERDTSEKQKLIKEAQKANLRAEFALMSAKLGFWDLDLVSGKTIVSPYWFEMLGYDDRAFEVTLEKFMSLLHPEDQPIFSSAIQAHLKGATTKFKAQFRMQHKQGGWVLIEDQGMITARDAQGNPSAMIGTHALVVSTSK